MLKNCSADIERKQLTLTQVKNCTIFVSKRASQICLSIILRIFSVKQKFPVFVKTRSTKEKKDLTFEAKA